MLILSRARGEKIHVGDITITICEIAGNRVRLGIAAPIATLIEREEVRQERLAREQQTSICTKPRRTRSQVLKQRENAVGGGCCERFADNQACDCLNTAIDGPKPEASR